MLLPKRSPMPVEMPLAALETSIPWLTVVVAPRPGSNHCTRTV
jgi:hypothetical protein